MHRVHIPRVAGGVACVCGSCTCGCHHCPGMSESLPFQGVTTYRVQYTPKESQHQRPYAPSKIAIVTPTPSSHFTTTNQQFSIQSRDMTNYEKTNPIIPLGTYQPSNGDFSGTTTQRHDYPAYEPGATRRTASAAPRRAMDAPPAYGVYETTNKAMQGPVAAMMRSGSLQRSSPALHQVTLSRSGAPLDGNTTYKEYFPPKKSVYERLFHARQRPSTAGPAAMLDDRDFKTMKSIHYPAHAAGARTSFQCPAVPFSKRPPSADGHISMK
jgi:hypothetical protein